jgi:hypothetical protein
VAVSPNPPVTMHCTTSQVNNCHTVSTTDVYGKNLFPSTHVKCLCGHSDYVPTTLVLNQSGEAVLITCIFTIWQCTVNRTSLPVPQIFEEEKLCTCKMRWWMVSCKKTCNSYTHYFIFKHLFPQIKYFHAFLSVIFSLQFYI